MDMTKAWNVVSYRLVMRIHAKLNSVRAAAHIDYGFSLERRLFYTGRFQRSNENARDRGKSTIAILCAIPYRQRLMFRLSFSWVCETSQRAQSISKLTGIILKLHILICGSWRSYHNTARIPQYPSQFMIVNLDVQGAIL